MSLTYHREATSAEMIRHLSVRAFFWHLLQKGTRVSSFGYLSGIGGMMADRGGGIAVGA